jgi:hypothetical protein
MPPQKRFGGDKTGCGYQRAAIASKGHCESTLGAAGYQRIYNSDCAIRPDQQRIKIDFSNVRKGQSQSG